MSLPRDLDDYSDDELTAELENRAIARSKGICDYCRQKASMTRPCGKPERHKLAKK